MPDKKYIQLAKLINKTTLILWDEAPMTNKYYFKALDNTLQLVRNNFNRPIGGMTVILSGDFRQILVIPNRIKENIIDVTINNSYLWPYFRILILTENMRLKKLNYCIDEQIEISNFSKWILNISNEIANEIKDTENENATWIKIPEKYIISYDANSIECISTTIYENLFDNLNNIDYLK